VPSLRANTLLYFDSSTIRRVTHHQHIHTSTLITGHRIVITTINVPVSEPTSSDGRYEMHTAAELYKAPISTNIIITVIINQPGYIGIPTAMALLCCRPTRLPHKTSPRLAGRHTLGQTYKSAACFTCDLCFVCSVSSSLSRPCPFRSLLVAAAPRRHVRWIE